jgi:RNA polymerase sigma-70 factor (ECF subfamily)
MIVESPEALTKQEWAECMERVKQRDKRAFATVFSYFSPRLKQFTYKHLGNEQVAIEMVQVALATVGQTAHLFDGSKSSLSTCIYNIARKL